MRKKVTLRELVGSRIILAALLAIYYWMWARRDWHDAYLLIQQAVGVFAALFFALQAMRRQKYHQEERDEMAERSLLRADSLCLKLGAAALIIIAFAGNFLTFSVGGESGAVTGYLLMGLLLALTIVRLIAFCILDAKGD